MFLKPQQINEIRFVSKTQTRLLSFHFVVKLRRQVKTKEMLFFWSFFLLLFLSLKQCCFWVDNLELFHIFGPGSGGPQHVVFIFIFLSMLAEDQKLSICHWTQNNSWKTFPLQSPCRCCSENPNHIYKPLLKRSFFSTAAFVELLFLIKDTFR